jgi:ppGpp synthetase/RelA/SpoT-type nucleotidyltranferase
MNTLLLEEYHKLMPAYERLNYAVNDMLREHIKSSSIEVNAIESRIKKEQSLIGKLERKGDKYHSIYDITDILGVRVIAFYNEDVDRIASIAEKIFDIDWANSVDKRKSHEVNSFGYNSLHYVCKIPHTSFYNQKFPEINDIYFELQIRTALQHVWSAIQHDIGYKTDIEIPDEYHRNLSRLAGVLELADNEFSRIRTAIADYRRHATKLVKSGKLEDVLLDGETFKTYLELAPFDKLNKKIAAITAAEIHATSLIHYLPVLKSLGMKTLRDVENMINDNENDAYQLALYQLGSTDIDILSSSIALQNLCIVHILKNGGGKLGLCRLFEQINGTSQSNEIMADFIFEQASKLSFMNIGKSDKS